jgi:hypothetical protein
MVSTKKDAQKKGGVGGWGGGGIELTGDLVPADLVLNALLRF